MPTAETQSLIVARSSSVKENRRRTTGAAATSSTSRRGEAGTGEVDQPRGQREQPIGLPQGPVGQLDPQPVRGVAVVDDLGQAEPGGDQRRILLDVGAEHQHVPGFEGRIPLQQADDDFAQHVDLAGRAVTGVHREAAIVRMSATAALRVAGRRRCRVAADAAGRSPGRSTGWHESVAAGGRPSCSSRDSRPNDARSGCRASAPCDRATWRPATSVRISVRCPGPIQRRARARRTGCGNQRWMSRCSANAEITLACRAGNRLSPNSDNRDGRSAPTPGRRPTPPGPRRPGAPDRPPEPGPARCATAVVARPDRPAARVRHRRCRRRPRQSAIMSGRLVAYRSNSPATRRATA